MGAGVSGAAVFTLTSWVTLAAIWAAAAITDYAVDRRDEEAKPTIKTFMEPGYVSP